MKKILEKLRDEEDRYLTVKNFKIRMESLLRKLPNIFELNLAIACLYLLERKIIQK